MPNFHVIGADLSLTGTAYASARHGLPVYVDRVRTEFEGRNPLDRVARYETITTPIVELARQHEATLLIVEGHSYGSSGKGKGQSGTHERAELVGTLLWRMRRHARAMLEVAPTTLKKWMAENGFASKDDMADAVEARFGRTFATDDEVDAYALTMLGVELVTGAMPAGKKQWEVVRDLRRKLEAAA